MPSKSEAQHRLMEAAAHTPGGYGGVPQSVGKEFAKADEAKDSAGMATGDSSRETDKNGYVTIYDNPITRAGVFQYMGKTLPDADPDKVYNVYRPLEELTNPETLESFKGLPIINDHEMLGERYQRSPEERGVHGSILESIAVKGRDIVANIRIWSRTLKALIDQGKKGLSLGYNCKWEKSSGVFEGIRYDYIQRNIRGNHLALVNQGRSGTAVLDQYDVLDEFDLVFDKQEIHMADEDKKPEEKKEEKKTEASPGGEKKTELSVKELHDIVQKHMPMIKEIMSHMEQEGEEKDEAALDGDTKEKPGDQALDKDEKEEKKDKAMDSAEVERIVNQRLKSATKNMMADVTQRDSLAKRLTPLVGTFDYAAMDSDDVAIYGVQKLELQAEKGHEKAVLTGYLSGIEKGKSTSSVGFAMDSAIKAPKSGGKLATRLNNAA